MRARVEARIAFRPQRNIRDPILYRVLRAHHTVRARVSADVRLLAPPFICHSSASRTRCARSSSRPTVRVRLAYRNVRACPAAETDRFRAPEPDLHVMIKRKLMQLVTEGIGGGTSGSPHSVLRLRASPRAIRRSAMIRRGQAREHHCVGLWSSASRDLNSLAPRACVPASIEVVIENYP